MVKSGNAEKYISDITKELTDRMAKDGKDYVSVVKITAASVVEKRA
jgi:hypothetical protein